MAAAASTATAAATAASAAPKHNFPTSNPLFALHNNARAPNKGYPTRVAVPDDRVDWSVEWAEYQPTQFTTESAMKKSPDNPDASLIPNLSSRASYEMSPLQLDPSTCRPLNPYGRTGLCGRGRLYYWGPNHAADPIVTRLDGDSLAVIVIQRGDTGAWALPGGMVDPGETPEQALEREFQEEAMGATDKNKDSAAIERLSRKIFHETKGQLVYKGYIDDLRNTDNAWMESYCLHYHLSPDVASELTPYLRAGDDARAVRWMKIDPNQTEFQQLYASHRPIIERAAEKWKEMNRKGNEQ